LDRGEAICRTSLGFTEPVKLKVYDSQDAPVTNEELAEMMKPQWEELLEGIEPARPQQELKFHTSKQSRKSAISQSKQSELPIEKTDTLSPEELIYLRAVVAHPYRLLTEIRELLSDEMIMGTKRIASSKASKIHKRLLKLGYLESVRVTGTGKSGRPYFDIVTEKANMGNVSKPRGNLLHAFWANRVAEFFRKKGASVKIGETISGKEVDIAVEIDDENWS
jgi:hypothetical protein